VTKYISSTINHKTKKAPFISIAGSHKKIKGKNIVKDSFVVFDIETTGLHAGNNEIIEIAAIKIANINNIEHDTFNALIKPKKSIPANITKITGITNEMIENADDIKTVLKDFCEFIEDYPLVGHNIDFDVKFVSNKANKCNIEFKNKMLIDTLPLSKKAFPELDNHKLTTLAEHIGINVDRNHRALDDVLATLYVYTVSTQLLYNFSK
jgi:DNA polymerase III epsilon subunit family exonuclease